MRQTRTNMALVTEHEQLIGVITLAGTTTTPPPRPDRLSATEPESLGPALRGDRRVPSESGHEGADPVRASASHPRALGHDLSVTGSEKSLLEPRMIQCRAASFWAE